MTKKQRELIVNELKAYINSHLADIKLQNTFTIRREMDNILTHGVVQAINENITTTLQEGYEIKLAIGLKAKSK